MKHSPFRLSTLLVAASLALAGCEVTAPQRSLPELTFSHLAPINMAVGSVVVDNRYRQPTTGTYVESRFPSPPARALERWAMDRLKPIGTGADGTLKLVITDASVRETPLKKDASFKGVFTKQQSHRYDMALRATIEIIGPDGRKQGDSSANASRTLTVREDLSLNEVEQRWLDATENLVNDFDKEMVRNLRQFLANWVR